MRRSAPPRRKRGRLATKPYGRRRGTGAAALAGCLALLLGLPGAASAAFPGENGLIAFTSDRAGKHDIWVMNPDGTGGRNLTPGSTAIDRDPSFSADGQRIAFVSDRAGKDDVWVMAADGSNQRNLTAGWPTWARGPSFSPDGSTIAFWSAPDGDQGIYLMDAGGGNVRVFGETSRGHALPNPTFSPDGELVGFTSLAIVAATSNAFVLPYPNPSRSDPRAGEVAPFPLLEGPDASGADPKLFGDFSPDGRLVAFVRDDPSLGLTIYTVPLTEARRGPFTRLTASGEGEDTNPAFSPDGSGIAFERGLSGSSSPPADTWVMGTDGANPRNLTRSAANDRQPAWQPLDAVVRLRFVGKPRLRVNRRRVARLRLVCPADEASPPCRGRVQLQTRNRVRFRGKRQRVRLARARFSIGAGRTQRVRLRLGRREVILLRTTRRARRAQAIANVRDGAGNSARVTRRLQLAVR